MSELRNPADDSSDDDDRRRRERVAALLAGLDLGDWSSGLVDAVAGDLAPVYGDGLRAVGFTAPGQTRNEARANLGLPPLGDDEGGDEVPDIVDNMDDRADEWSSEHAADLVSGLKERTLGMLETTVIAALAGGWTAKQLDSAVAEAPAFNRARAESITDNEVNQAEREGLNVAMRNSQVAEGKVWQTQEDEAVEEDCEENADAGVIPITDDFPNGDYPHIGCLPGDALVAAAAIKAASQRWYDGDLVVIDTAAGQQLRATPNHPILTAEGWIAAHLLNEGDRVVSYRPTDAVLFDDPDGENVPACIEDIAIAFRRADQVSLTPMPVSAIDFHGDGGNSEVAIIWSDRLLQHDVRDTPASEHRGELPLVMADIIAEEHIGMGALDALLEAATSPACCRVRRRDLPLPLHQSHVGPFDELGLRSAAGGNAVFDEPRPDGPTVHAEPVSKRLFRDASQVQADHLGCVDPSTPATYQLRSGAPQGLVDDGAADARFPLNNDCSLTGEIFLDSVVNACRIRFVGHVYNLETPLGWYVANGVIVHNCRCWYELADLDEDEQ